MSVYQMIRSDRVSTRRGQLPFGRPAVGRKPANALRKCRPDLSPSTAFSPRPARLRTETSYKAGSTRRVSQSSQSRSHWFDQVNGELVQGQFTFLSGDVCIDGLRVIVTPTRRTCLKSGNGIAKAFPGGAEISRGHSTGCHHPVTPGRTER
jgi:hypothetical protein